MPRVTKKKATTLSEEMIDEVSEVGETPDPVDEAPEKIKEKAKKKSESSTVENAYKALQKQFPGRPQIDFIDTGSFVLNRSLGGGYARGRIMEMYGQTGTGKSTVLLHGCQSACEAGMRAIYIDAEWALNESLIEGVGVTQYLGKNFLLHKARTFSEIDQLLMTYLDTNDPPEMIVIDSAQAMLPSKKVTGNVEDVEPGLQARYMSAFMQKYKSWVGNTNSFLGIINQVRMKFKKTGKGGWDVTEGSAGGNALAFYSDIRLEMRAGEKILEVPDDPDTLLGNQVRVWTRKNKVAKMQNCIIPVLFGVGVSNVMSMKFYLEDVAQVVTQGGPWYTIDLGDGVEHKVRGKADFAEWIRANYSAIITFLTGKGHL